MPTHNHQRLAHAFGYPRETQPDLLKHKRIHPKDADEAVRLGLSACFTIEWVAMGDILILDVTTLWMIAANKAFVYGK